MFGGGHNQAVLAADHGGRCQDFSGGGVHCYQHACLGIGINHPFGQQPLCRKLQRPVNGEDQRLPFFGRVDLVFTPGDGRAASAHFDNHLTGGSRKQIVIDQFKTANTDAVNVGASQYSQA